MRTLDESQSASFFLAMKIGLISVGLLAFCQFSNAFTVGKPVTTTRLVAARLSATENGKEPDGVTDRRSWLASAAGAAVGVLGLSQAPVQAEEIPITAFNGLIFNYRGGQFSGLDASTLNEPSVPFVEFGEKLEKNQVAFVEFLAPDGDAAYVTFKGTEEEPNPKPIRIGQGYPIEQHDGWSSPSFVVRALENYKVPYKFTIPALAKFQN